MLILWDSIVVRHLCIEYIDEPTAIEQVPSLPGRYGLGSKFACSLTGLFCSKVCMSARHGCVAGTRHAQALYTLLLWWEMCISIHPHP